ncbi:LysR family transcriptional regulator [Acinetobacter rudis]|uniref:LysR family transcriptional regulator n=1 Tax=Acinetobacter rudis TaxID=632955 RepID=UPI0033409272
MNIMHFIPNNFDLNLLIVFSALYKHRNVSHAAESLFISPSAFSHALNRLRSALQDPLFVRVDGEMKPTKIAEKIAPAIFDSLEILSTQLFNNEEFDYKKSSYKFSIAATEYTIFSILPSLIKRCRTLAPNISLKIIHESRENSFKNMQLGKIDFTIGYSEQVEELPKDLESFKCFKDKYVVVAPKGKYQSINLEEYIQANHIRINAWHEHNGIIDQSLKKIRLKRNIVVELPNIMSSPYLIEGSDLIITLPYKAAIVLQDFYSIEFFELPFRVPEYQVNIFSVKQDELNPAQTWLINQIKDLNWQ